MSEPLISIIVTALNEELSIGEVAANIAAIYDKLHLDGELVLVDDGSSDRTTEIARQWTARDPRVVMVRHETPHGVGASFWEGVNKARGRFVCWLPGDNEVHPWEILRYVPLLEHVDLVVPFALNKAVRPPLRNFLSGLFRFIVNTTFWLSLNYSNGTGIYRRSVLRGLPVRSTGFFFMSDLVIRSIKQGYLFAEVPFGISFRAHGKSKALSLKSLASVSRSYLRLLRDYYFDHQRKFPTGIDPESSTAARFRECGLPITK